MKNQTPFNVDICATCISSKPPRLPLREELPSLGFEVILNAEGVGAKAVKHEVDTVWKEFKKNDDNKRLRKRRFFFKSSKRIRDELAERKRIELEIKTPHALSYDEYEYELRHLNKKDTDTSWTSSETSYPRVLKQKQKSMSGRLALRRKWGLRRRVRNQTTIAKDSGDGKEVSTSKNDAMSLGKLIGKSAFEDLLMSIEHASHLGESSSSSTFSRDMSTLSSKDGNEYSGLEIRFLKSDIADKHLPALRTFDESHVDNKKTEASKNEFKRDDSEKKRLQVDKFSDFLKDIFESSQSDEESGVATRNVFKAGYQVEAVNSWLGENEFASEKTQSLNDAKLLNKGSVSEENQNTDSMCSKQSGEASQLIFTSSDKKQRPFPELVPKSKSGGGSVGSSKNEGSEKEAKVVHREAGQSNELVIHEKMSSEVELQTISGAQLVLKESFDNFPYSDQPSTDLITENDSLQIIIREDQQEPKTYGSFNLEECAKSWKLDGPFDQLSDDEIKHISQHGIQTEKSTYQPFSWIWSAKTMFDNIADDVYRATRIMPGEVDGKQIVPNVANKARNSAEANDVDKIYALLLDKESNIEMIAEIVDRSPELFMIKRQEDARYPLHILCDRGMPDRRFVSVDSLTKTLLRDILCLRQLLSVISKISCDAVLSLDKYNDLPAHLLARRLMEWEAEWYENVYERAILDDQDQINGSLGITKLYQTMSECIEILLRPVADSVELCQAGGSIGLILPLHIATIFSVSVETLRLILEKYPDAASIRCVLSNVGTLIPDKALPIELHDKLSTDFPKWEAEASYSAYPEITWSQAKNGHPSMENCMRRSDLIFAFNPNVKPFNNDKARIRRVESRVRFEAKYIPKFGSMSVGAKHLWIWMCTTEDPVSGGSQYRESVKRIVDALPLRAVEYLAGIETKDGECIVNVARKDCYLTLFDRLKHAMEGTIILGSPTMNNATEKELETEAIKEDFSENPTATLCRMLFNVQREDLPASFVILPYLLSSKVDGKLQIESKDGPVLAVKFADCLLNLTHPKCILETLHKKSVKHYADPIIDENAIGNNDFTEHEDALLRLYEETDAYLYFIDENTGLPLVSSTHSVYPIKIENPRNIVRKLLPLMKIGMLLMRGERALTVINGVLTDKSIISVLPHWNTILLALSSGNESSLMENTIHLNVSEGKGSSFEPKNAKATLRRNECSEWAVEVELLKMLTLKMDKKQSSDVFSAAKSNEIKTDAGFCLETSVFANEISEDEDSGDLSISMLSQKHETLSDMWIAGNMRPNQAGSMLGFPQPYNDDSDAETDGTTKGSVETNIMILESSTRTNSSNDCEAEKVVKDKGLPPKDISLSRDYAGHREVREPSDSPRQTTNEGERVYIELMDELENAPYWEDVKIIQLKVQLAEQAKRLSSLGKTVISMKEKEMQLFSKQNVVLNDDSEQFCPRGLFKAQQAYIRLCDLEGRMLCDEIELQHLSLGTAILDEMTQELLRNATGLPTIQISDHSAVVESSVQRQKRRNGQDKKEVSRVQAVRDFPRRPKNQGLMPTPEIPSYNVKHPLSQRGASTNPFDECIHSPNLDVMKTSLYRNPFDDASELDSASQGIQTKVAWVKYHESTGQIEF